MKKRKMILLQQHLESKNSKQLVALEATDRVEGSAPTASVNLLTENLNLNTSVPE